MSLDLTQLPGFALVSLVVALTPGVDAFLLLRTSMRSGSRAGLRALAGIYTASVIHVALVVSGLGTLVTEHPPLLSTLRWLGAAYLLYLAGTLLRELWRARHEPRADQQTATPGGASDQSAGNPYARGFLSNITNPKMLLFSLAFLPQFIGTATAPVAQLIVLGVTFLVVAALWEFVLVFAASRIAGRLRRPRVIHALDAVCATVFVTLSVGLVTS